MAQKGTILVGTIGQGVMMSPDDGESWTRASVRLGMHSDCIVQALLVRSPAPGCRLRRDRSGALSQR